MLTKTQRQIVEAPLRPSIQVLAGTGCGKTRVWFARIDHILRTTCKENVLALTMGRYSVDHTPIHVLFPQYLTTNRLWVGSLEEFAKSIIENYGHTMGLTESRRLIQSRATCAQIYLHALCHEGYDLERYLEVTEGTTLQARVDYYLNQFSQMKRRGLTDPALNAQEKDPTLYLRFLDYQSALEQANALDADDTLRYATQILVTYPSIAELYHTLYTQIVIDDAHEINSAQYELIKVLASGPDSSLFMAGNPEATLINEGASPHLFQEQFVADFSPKTFQLTQNFRFSKAIMQLTASLGLQSVARHRMAYQGHVQCTAYDDVETQAHGVVASIESLLMLQAHDDIEDKITLSSMAIIGQNRFEFTPLIALLNEKGLSYVWQDLGQAHRPVNRFAQVLDHAITLKVNPHNTFAYRSLVDLLALPLATLAKPVSLSELATQLTERHEAEDTRLAYLLNAFEWLSEAFPDIENLSTDVAHHVRVEVGDRTHLTNEQLYDLDLTLKSLQELKQLWVHYRANDSALNLEKFQTACRMRLGLTQAPRDAITLCTADTMHGIEKDIVFVVGLNEGIFPMGRSDTPAALKSLQRTALTAFTRAKRWLYLSYPKIRHFQSGDEVSLAPSAVICDKSVSGGQSGLKRFRGIG